MHSMGFTCKVRRATLRRYAQKTPAARRLTAHRKRRAGVRRAKPPDREEKGQVREVPHPSGPWAAADSRSDAFTDAPDTAFQSRNQFANRARFSLGYFGDAALEFAGTSVSTARAARARKSRSATFAARTRNANATPQKRTRPNRGIRQRFSLDFVTPAASRSRQSVRLASRLRGNRAAELHRLMRNFLAASAESDSNDNGGENDSALHG